VPLATWFRYRAAAEKTQTSILLITQHSCAKSSAGVVLNQQSQPRQDEATVLGGTRHRVEVSRQRFMQVTSNVVPMRKPPQRDMAAALDWDDRTTWVRRT
jgi:hypothetical protein